MQRALSLGKLSVCPHLDPFTWIRFLHVTDPKTDALATLDPEPTLSLEVNAI